MIAALARTSVARWASVLIAMIGVVVLYAPALEAGYLADDLFQISMIEGLFESDGPWALYAFVTEDPVATTEHIVRGSLPWWTVPHFRFTMVRPGASLTLALDHAVAPRAAFVHHLHSLLWLLATLLTAYGLLAQAIGERLPRYSAFAMLACAAFAIDETMVWLVGWLAHRCTLVSATFGFAAVAAHIRTRHEGPPTARDRVIALLLWTLAFSGGEYALGAVAYLVAYELVGARGPWRLRGSALLPMSAVLVLFTGLYLVTGGGVYGGTSYIDPFSDPLRFMDAALERLLRMSGEVWLNLAGETERFFFRYEDVGLARWVMPEDGADVVTQRLRHARFSGLAVLASVLPTWWLARRYLDERERTIVRWMACGSVLAMVPIAAIPPATRSLLFPNLGAAVFVSAVLIGAVRAIRWVAVDPPALLYRLGLALVALGWVYVHVVREAAYAREQVVALEEAQSAHRTYYGNPAFEAVDVHDKHVVVIATPGLVTGIHGMSMLNVLDRPLPRTWHVLAMGDRPYLVRRFGQSTLELTSVGDAMHHGPHEALWRPVDEALRVGDRVDAGVFEAEVIHERPGKGPDAVLFHFRLALDNPRLVFLAVGPEGLQPFTLPPDEKSVVVKPPKLPRVVPRG